MTVVRVYGFLRSTWTRTACMTCIEKGLEYELVPVAYGTEEHGVLHPFRRMPILEAGETKIFESLAIAGYLDEGFDGPALQPADLASRTRMRMWMGICGDYVFRDVVRAIPRDREPSDDELATARSTIDRVEALMGEHEFLAGQALSLADLFLAPQIANGEEKAPELLEGRSQLRAWMSRLSERESFRRTRS